jgi:hypothetical protein
MTLDDLNGAVKSGAAKVEAPEGDEPGQSSAASSVASPSTKESSLADFEPLLQFIPFLFDLRDGGGSSSPASVKGRSHGAASTSIPGGFSPTKVQLNGNDFANGITWDSTNHRFVATAAGIYRISGTVGYNGSTSGKQYHAMIYMNGSEVSRGGENSNGSAYLAASVTDLVKLAVGDYVELYTEHNDTSSNSIYNGAGLTYFTIDL